MCLRPRRAWRSALGALLLLALFSLRSSVVSAGPEPEAVLWPDYTAALPNTSLDSLAVSPWSAAGRREATAGELKLAAAVAQACTDPVNNGGFETGTFMYWTTGGSPSVTLGGRTAIRSAMLGGSNQDSDEISQELPCPYYGEKVVAHAYVYMSTQDWQEGADWLLLSAYDSRGLGGDSYYYNNQAENWWLWTFIGTGAHACDPGTPWTVRFRAETDAYLPTVFLIDDVSLEACCPGDAFEPNDSFATAYSPITGTMNVWLCPDGDEDWCQFDAVASKVIVADSTNAGALQGDLCLHRPGGSQVECSTNASGAVPEHIQRVADQSGSWRVRVYDPASGTSTVASQLQVQVRDQPTPTAT